MSKKKLAIVSSYNTLCGNATYSAALKKEFSKYFDVETFHIDNSYFKLKASVGQQRIEEIVSELGRFDYVNIQAEAGLFGLTPTQMIKNISKCIKACENVIITIHRVDYIESNQNLFRNIFINPLSFKKELKKRMRHYITSKLITACKVLGRKKKVSIMVHTKRSSKYIKQVFKFPQVHEFPITFLPENNRNSVNENVEIYKREMQEFYKLDKNKINVGIFGFLSNNKGHHTAVEAAKLLGPDYNLLIFGGQHPGSIDFYEMGFYDQLYPKKVYPNNHPYIANLINQLQTYRDELHEGQMQEHLVKIKNFYKKNTTQNEGDSVEPFKFDESQFNVKMLGNVDDEAYIKYMRACDFIVLPYFETGQDGSGNASIAFEVKHPRVLTSRAKHFFELGKFYKNCFSTFDIANPIQLYQKILAWDDSTDKLHSKNLATALESYNIENNIKKHIEIFENAKIINTHNSPEKQL